MHQRIVDRFWKKVEKTETCWLWTGAKSTNRYGLCFAKGAPKRAHRIAYNIALGDIPSGFYVCHKCDEKLCVNPDHLFLSRHGNNPKNTEETR